MTLFSLSQIQSDSKSHPMRIARNTVICNVGVPCHHFRSYEGDSNPYKVKLLGCSLHWSPEIQLFSSNGARLRVGLGGGRGVCGCTPTPDSPYPQDTSESWPQNSVLLRNNLPSFATPIHPRKVRATTTKHHRLGDLNTRHLCLHGSGARG
jgi:hypothetical protein